LGVQAEQQNPIREPVPRNEELPPASRPVIIWQRIQEQIRIDVDRFTYETWFAKTVAIGIDGTRLVVQAPALHSAYIERNYGTLIARAIGHVAPGMTLRWLTPATEAKVAVGA
jgi:hypothetical protein